VDGGVPYFIHPFRIANDTNMLGFHRLPRQSFPILQVLDNFTAKYTKIISMQQFIIVRKPNQ